eukprot:1454089-Pyramimonas_sp.AAC.1
MPCGRPQMQQPVGFWGSAQGRGPTSHTVHPPALNSSHRPPRPSELWRNVSKAGTAYIEPTVEDGVGVVCPPRPRCLASRAWAV